MPSLPAATLLVPCYNAARFLPRLWESVQRLTVPFADILCYDDGSTDDTVEVAHQLGWRIATPNVNRGVAHARNRLAAAARTEWIHFHDADDLIAPNYVERLDPWCDARNDVVSCDANWIDEISRAIVISWHYDPAELSRAPVPHLLTRAMGLNNSIIRRSAWAKINGCDETLAIWEDADVHIRLAWCGARFHHVPEVLTWSLRRSESFSHDYRRNWTCRVSALERYADMPGAATFAGPLAAEAERAASGLAELGERNATRRAVALCRRFGVNPPTSRHPLVQFLKIFLPAYPLLRWQSRHRQRQPASD